MTAVVKLFEVRDEGTTMAVVALKPDSHNEAERWLYARSGYGSTPAEQGCYVMLAPMHAGEGMLVCDPFKHPSRRTLPVAHRFIIDNWNVLQSGDVVDVEHILGEAPERKAPERESY